MASCTRRMEARQPSCERVRCLVRASAAIARCVTRFGGLAPASARHVAQLLKSRRNAGSGRLGDRRFDSALPAADRRATGTKSEPVLAMDDASGCTPPEGCCPLSSSTRTWRRLRRQAAPQSLERVASLVWKQSGIPVWSTHSTACADYGTALQSWTVGRFATASRDAEPAGSELDEEEVHRGEPGTTEPPPLPR